MITHDFFQIPFKKPSVGKQARPKWNKRLHTRPLRTCIRACNKNQTKHISTFYNNNNLLFKIILITHSFFLDHIQKIKLTNSSTFYNNNLLLLII